jgi:ABC-type phosphate transport system substrate-binding protein
MSAMKKSILSFLFFSFFLGCGIAKAQALVVVANKSVKSADISAGDLKDVYSGDKSSLKDGSHVIPVTLKGGAIHEAFLKKFIGKNDPAFRAAWRSLVFTGQGSMPRSLDTEADMLEFVAATPGAIGYVSAAAGAASKEGVKTLAVK